MTEFGFDIQEEILLRLEVKDLFRCKSVCKSWNSLISSRRFEKSHLNYNLKKNVDNNETGDTRIIALLGANSRCGKDCFNDRRHAECQVVGSSNGLVCISRYRKFLVVNPSTREVKVLESPPYDRYRDYRTAHVSGFGYDSSIDDYKVVIGFRTDGHLNYVFKVLRMKSNVWKSVALESSYDSNFYGNGILCNGAIHWCTYRNGKKVIVSFDLSKEVFTEISQPKLRRSDWDLGTMKDRLCIFASPNIDFKNNEDIEIWVMKNYNVQESWERKLPPPGYVTRKTLMHYIPQDQDFLNRHVHIWLLEEGSYPPVLVRSIERPYHELIHGNTYYPHIRLSAISECNYNYDEHVFVKSLVSPHGTGDDDGGDGNMNDVISLSTLYL